VRVRQQQTNSNFEAELLSPAQPYHGHTDYGCTTTVAGCCHCSLSTPTCQQQDPAWVLFAHAIDTATDHHRMDVQPLL
jgi:hypothetical protein